MDVEVLLSLMFTLIVKTMSELMSDDHPHSTILQVPTCTQENKQVIILMVRDQIRSEILHMQNDYVCFEDVYMDGVLTASAMKYIFLSFAQPFCAHTHDTN